MNGIYMKFLDYTKGIPSNLEIYALSLLGILITIDIAMLAFEIEGTDMVKTLIKKIFKYGMIIFLIKNYSNICRTISEGFIFIAEKGVNVGHSIDSPEDVYEMGVKLSEEFFGKTKGRWYSITVDTILNGLMGFIILGSFFVIALVFMMTWIEFYVLVGIGIMFVPFLVLSKTAFLTEKIISLIISLSVKLMTMTLILNVTFSILEKMEIATKELTFARGLSDVSVVLIIGYMMVKLPEMASSLLTGNPSLGGSDISRLVGSSGGFAGRTAANFGKGTVGKGEEKIVTANNAGKTVHTAGRAVGRNIGDLVGKVGLGKMAGKIKRNS